MQTEGYVHATPAIVDGVAYIAGCDEILRGIRIADGKEVLTMSSGAYTGASPAIVDGRAYFGTYENEVLAVDLKSQEDRLALQASGAELSVLLVGRAVRADRVIVGGRDKMVHALDRKTGKAAWTFTTRRARRFVAGRRRRPRLHRLERRQALRARCRDRQELFEFEAGGPLSASPAIASGRLVIGSQDGKLFCLGA